MLQHVAWLSNVIATDPLFSWNSTNARRNIKISIMGGGSIVLRCGELLFRFRRRTSANLKDLFAWIRIYLLVSCSISVQVVVANVTPQSAEGRIVTALTSLGLPGTHSELDEVANTAKQVETHLKKVGIPWDCFKAYLANSINVCFTYESQDQLLELREHYESGKMKEVLQTIFSLLAGEDVNVELRWTYLNTGARESGKTRFVRHNYSIFKRNA